MKKKILAILTCAAVALSMTACADSSGIRPVSSDDKSSKESSTSSKVSTPSDSKDNSSSDGNSSGDPESSVNSSAESSDSEPESSSSVPEESQPETPSTPAFDWDSVPYADELDFLVEDVEGGVAIKEYLGTEAIVKIPETIDGKPVVGISDKAFYNRGITEVKLPGTLTTIGREAFRECYQLKNIDIPAGTTTIGGYAFAECDSIASVTIPDSVKYSVYITTFFPELTIITYKGKTYDYAHRGVLSSVIYLGETTMIVSDDGVLAGVRADMVNVVVPGNVTSIAGRAFSGCIDLTSVTIPEGVISIGKEYESYGSGYVFNNTLLHSLTLPDSLTYLDKDTFGGSYITEVTYKGKTYKENQFPNLFKAVNGG